MELATRLVCEIKDLKSCRVAPSFIIPSHELQNVPGQMISNGNGAITPTAKAALLEAVEK